MQKQSTEHEKYPNFEVSIKNICFMMEWSTSTGLFLIIHQQSETQTRRKAIGVHKVQLTNHLSNKMNCPC